MSEKKIDLIAQLLAKAESTTPEEAEALTEHAERLMVKYMIDQATIDERRRQSGQAQEKIVEVRMTFTGAYRGEMVNLAAMIAYGLGSVRSMQYTGGTGKIFHSWFIGFESDVNQAVILFNSLQVQSAVAVRAWWKLNSENYSHANSYGQEKARRSFVHGFGTGAGARIKASRQVVLQDVSKGTELVLASREAKVQEHVDSISGGKAKARTATGSDAAAGQGYHAGQNANTGDKAVSQGRGIEA